MNLNAVGQVLCELFNRPASGRKSVYRTHCRTLGISIDCVRSTRTVYNRLRSSAVIVCLSVAENIPAVATCATGSRVSFSTEDDDGNSVVSVGVYIA